MTTATFLTGQAPLSGLWHTAFNPPQRGFASISHWVGTQNPQRHRVLSRENRELRAQVAEAEERSRQNHAVLSENQRLRMLLNLPDRNRSLSLTDVNVIGFNGGNFARHFIIDSGQNDGIEVGMAVINEQKHLAGIVSQVDSRWATVQAVIDTHLSIGAMLDHSRANGVATGHFNDMQENMLRLEHMPDDAELNIGDVVVTSGINNTFPEGLVIGTVAAVQPNQNGLGDFAHITPAIEFAELRYLFVVTDFENER